MFLIYPRQAVFSGAATNPFVCHPAWSRKLAAPLPGRRWLLWATYSPRAGTLLLASRGAESKLHHCAVSLELDSQVTGHEISARVSGKHLEFVPPSCLLLLSSSWGREVVCCWIIEALGGLLIGMPQPKGCTGTFGMPTSLHHSCWKQCLVRWLQGLGMSHTCTSVTSTKSSAIKLGISSKSGSLLSSLKIWEEHKRWSPVLQV